jgi:hypothetical protein
MALTVRRSQTIQGSLDGRGQTLGRDFIPKRAVCENAIIVGEDLPIWCAIKTLKYTKFELRALADMGTIKIVDRKIRVLDSERERTIIFAFYDHDCTIYDDTLLERSGGRTDLPPKKRKPILFSAYSRKGKKPEEIRDAIADQNSAIRAIFTMKTEIAERRANNEIIPQNSPDCLDLKKEIELNSVFRCFTIPFPRDYSWLLEGDNTFINKLISNAEPIYDLISNVFRSLEIYDDYALFVYDGNTDSKREERWLEREKEPGLKRFYQKMRRYCSRWFTARFLNSKKKRRVAIDLLHGMNLDVVENPCLQKNRRKEQNKARRNYVNWSDVTKYSRSLKRYKVGNFCDYIVALFLERTRKIMDSDSMLGQDSDIKLKAIENELFTRKDAFRSVILLLQRIVETIVQSNDHSYVHFFNIFEEQIYNTLCFDCIARTFLGGNDKPREIPYPFEILPPFTTDKLILKARFSSIYSDPKNRQNTNKKEINPKTQETKVIFYEHDTVFASDAMRRTPGNAFSSHSIVIHTSVTLEIKSNRGYSTAIVIDDSKLIDSLIAWLRLMCEDLKYRFVFARKKEQQKGGTYEIDLKLISMLRERGLNNFANNLLKYMRDRIIPKKWFQKYEKPELVSLDNLYECMIESLLDES